MLEYFQIINVIILCLEIQVNFNISDLSGSAIMAQRNTERKRNYGKVFWYFTDNRLVYLYLSGTIEIILGGNSLGGLTNYEERKYADLRLWMYGV